MPEFAGWARPAERPILNPAWRHRLSTHDWTPQLTPRQWLIVLHDLLATAAALTVTIFIRFEDAELAARLEWLPELLAGVRRAGRCRLFLTGLHEAKWRFTSMPELKRIIRASAVLAIVVAGARLHAVRRRISTARSSSARSPSRFIS